VPKTILKKLSRPNGTALLDAVEKRVIEGTEGSVGKRVNEANEGSSEIEGQQE
jgi:hypothetical protein